MSDILDYWSLRSKTPRESQIRILEVIDEAFESYNNVILDAGVGIGKSAIATTLLNSFHEGYIVTMTNQLLEQYRDDFPNLYYIKGRNNYPCLHGGNCKDCVCDAREILRCEKCPYLKAVREISLNPEVITNYDYLYYASNFAGYFHKRNLLIFDEAHNFEKKIMDLVSETLTRRFVYNEYHFDIFKPIMKREPLKSLDKEYWRGIIKKCIDKESERYCKNKVEEKKQEYRLKKYKRMLEILDYYIIDLPLKKDITNEEELSISLLKMTLKPLQLTDESQDLFRFGEKRLFMTGTLGDKDKFCGWNGIDSEDTFYHYEKSPFPVEHRPIYNLKSCSMKHGAWKNTGLIRVIQRIIKDHSGEKGVIHTSSNEQAWWIKKNLASNKVWVVHGKTREDTIHNFEESTKDIVLIGAGIKDGVNFNEDKCRYQILFKVPFPSIDNEQIRQRKKLDGSWYIYNTIMPLMQSYGRGVRNENDTCDYYILDRDFDNVLKNYRYFFNEYFLEAII